jgi:hypothetical protein
MLFFAAPMGQAQLGNPHIKGRSAQGWTIDIQGSRGAFTAYGQTWNVELIFDWLGQSGFFKTIWFLGRRPDNYLLGFVLVNIAGDSFVVWQFDYRNRRLSADRFQGSYDVGGLKIQLPSSSSGYVPVGPVPGYSGRDFRVQSPIAHVSPPEGRLIYQGTELTVYPVYNLEVGGEFFEFWAIAIDPKTQHTYHLIFYSHQPNGWVVDLWNGVVSFLPLGQASVMGGPVAVHRTVVLGQ